MTPAEREQIISMSPAGRISHYLKKKIAGEITSAQYDAILEVVLRLPYTTVIPKDSETRTDIGEQPQDQRGLVQVQCEDEMGRNEAEIFVKQNTDTPPVECSSEEFISGLSDVSTVSGHSTAKDNTSQKQRLLTFLSDHEWKTTPQIQVAVYGANHLGVARIGARVNDLKNDGYKIESRKVTQSIWEYKLVEEGLRWITENIASG